MKKSFQKYTPRIIKFGTTAVFYASTFLQLLNGPRSSIFEFLNLICEGPNSTIMDLYLNQTNLLFGFELTKMCL